MNKNIIIIPAYNEEKNIVEVLKTIKQKYSDAEIVVINDGSTDRTKIYAKGENVSVISHFFNMGYGTALQTGYKYAFRNGYNYLVQMDADGQHDPCSISYLFSEIEKNSADIILGSRFLGSSRYKATLFRRVGMYVFGSIVSYFTRQKITDPTSGFQAINRKVMFLYSQEAFPPDFPDADVLIMSHRAGLKIEEIPVIMHESADKKSMHRGLRPVYYIYKMFLSIFAIVLTRKQDVHIGA